MFEANALRTALAVPLMLAGAWRTVDAQTVAEYRHRLDSLAVEWRIAAAADVKTDSVQRRTLPADTVRVGNLVALTDARFASLARATLARIAPMADSAYGTTARELARHPFVLRANPADSTVVVTGVADSAGEIHVLSSDFRDEKPLANSWRNKLDVVMTDEAPPDFQHWLRGVIPTAPPTADTWTNGRIELVLADSRVSHACVRGDVQGCLLAFSLVPVSDPAFELYDEDEQRTIIDTHAYLLRRTDPAAYDSCMTKHVRTACTTILRGMPAEAIPQPLPTSVRQSLVRYALMIGGRDAFTRLVRTAGTPREALEAAARMPAESLVVRWRATVVNTSRGNAIDFATAIASIAWAGLFAGLALRSSRWR